MKMAASGSGNQQAKIIEKRKMAAENGKSVSAANERRKRKAAKAPKALNNSNQPKNS